MESGAELNRDRRTISSTRQLVILALMVAQALVLSIVESWIPMPSNIPGIKLGLANIITFTAIIFFDYRAALVIVVLRTFLASLFVSGLVVFVFSISGGILSTIVMAVLYKKFEKRLSITGISIAGAAAHNTGQIIAAAVIMRDAGVISYLPVLLGVSLVTGFFTGLCTDYLVKALRKTKLFQ